MQLEQLERGNFVVRGGRLMQPTHKHKQLPVYLPNMRIADRIAHKGKVTAGGHTFFHPCLSHFSGRLMTLYFDRDRPVCAVVFRGREFVCIAEVLMWERSQAGQGVGNGE